MAELSQFAAEREGAVRAAYRALRPLLMSERAFVASVSEVRVREEQFVRALYTLERRGIAHHMEPAPGTRRADLTPFAPCTLAPWQADPKTLPDSTRQLCECVHCDGTKKAPCDECSGSGKRVCMGCGGGGKVHGQRGLKKCSDCRGSGRYKCGACSNGKVECPRCEGVGRVVSWFEVERSTQSQVRADPEHNARRWYPAALDARDFERSQPSASLKKDGAVEVHKLEELAPGLRPQLEVNDRVIAVRAQTFSFNVYEVHYRTALSEGRVEVAGESAEVSAVDRGPLVLRSRLAATVAGLFALLALCAVSAYRGQHPWFAERGEGGLGLSLGLLASALLGVAALGWVLAAPARTRWNTWLPTVSGAASALMAAIVLLVSGPSASAARDALNANDLEQALLVADAMRKTDIASAHDESLFDDIRLAQLRAVGEVETQARLLTEPSWSAPARAQGIQVLEKAIRSQAAAALARGDHARLARLATTTTALVPALSRELHLQALALDADASLQRADFARLPKLVEQLSEHGDHQSEVRIRVLAEAKARKMLEAELGLAQRAPAVSSGNSDRSRSGKSGRSKPGA